MNRIELELSTQEIQTILDALGARPHNQVRALIDKIYRQAQAQLPPPEPAGVKVNGQAPGPEPQPEATPPTG